MNISFDTFRRFETPQLILCNPSSRFENNALTTAIGELVNVSDISFDFDFGSYSELNFRINNIRHEDSAKNSILRGMFDGVMNRRQIFVPEVGFFQIVDTRYHKVGEMEYKDVQARSCDCEIARKNVPFIEDGTYTMNITSVTSDNLLSKILPAITPWTVVYVDPDVSALYRTFEDVDVNMDVWTFFTEDIQKAFECVVEFDIINRQISIYSQANYVDSSDRKTTIHLSYEELVDQIDIEENGDNLFTALRVSTSDDISIGDVNPMGGNVLYDFSYYYDWMSPGLRAWLESWEASFDLYQAYYAEESEGYYTQLEIVNNLIAELSRLQMLLDLYEECKDHYEGAAGEFDIDVMNELIESNGGEPITVYESVQQTLAEIEGMIDDTEDEISDDEDDLAAATVVMTQHQQNMDTVRSNVSFSDNLTPEQYNELSSYLFEGTYQDDFIAVTDEMDVSEIIEQHELLMQRAQKKLKSVSQPTREFNVDTVSFVFEKKFANWTNQLVPGCAIDVEVSADEVDTLYLTGFSVNYEDRTARLRFGNMIGRSDTKSLFDKVLGEISVSPNTIL